MNHGKASLPLTFMVDPMPHFEVEVYDARGRRIDVPKGTPPKYKSKLAQRAETKAAQVTLDSDGEGAPHAGVGREPPSSGSGASQRRYNRRRLPARVGGPAAEWAVHDFESCRADRRAEGQHAHRDHRCALMSAGGSPLCGPGVVRSFHGY